MAESVSQQMGLLLFGFIVLALVGVVSLVLRYAFRYARTSEDKQKVLLGDDYIDASIEPRLDAGGLAITIEAPSFVVWQHMKQFGQDRAGWYSFELLERLFTFDIHNHYTIHSEWQDIQPGRFLFYHQPPWGIGSLIIAADERSHQFASSSDSRKQPVVAGSVYFVPPLKLEYFCWTWNFAAFDLGFNRTRYMFTAQAGFEPFTKPRIVAVAVLLGLPSLIMGSRHMKVLKQVCEGQKSSSPRHL